MPQILVQLMDWLLVFHPMPEGRLILVLGLLLCILKHGSFHSSDSLPFAWQVVIHPLSALLHPLLQRLSMLNPVSSLPKLYKSTGENLGEYSSGSPL